MSNLLQVQALLRMERQVLDVLEFRINSPTPYTFLRFFRHINPLQPAASALASYLIVSRLMNLLTGCGRWLFDVELTAGAPVAC